MKKLLLSIVALFATLSIASAATMSLSYSGDSTNLVALTNGGYILQSIQVIPSGTNTTTRLYDWDLDTLTYTNDAYVTRRTFSTNVVNNYITSTGVTNYLTNTVTYVQVYTNAETTNDVAALMTVVTPSGTVGTYTLGFPLINGLTVSNDVTSTVILNYRLQ